MTTLDQPARRLKDDGDALHVAGEFLGPDTTRRAGSARCRARMRFSPEREIDTASRLHSHARIAVASMFEDARAGRTLDVPHWFALLDAISSSLARKPSAMFALIRSRQENRRTVMHSVSVCVLMMRLSQHLGRSPAQVREAGLAGMLHDIGGSPMRSGWRSKTGNLSPAEVRRFENLPRVGHAMLKRSGCTSSMSLDACLHHHARYDGAGFPDGIVTSEISIEARMLAVCDVYDEMTSNPPHEDGLEPAQAIVRMAELTRQGQFDPRLFLAFVECMGIYPVGSLVRLRSGRIGLVTEQSGNVPYAPRVKVFYATGVARPISVETVDLSQTDCGDDIVARESNAEWQFRCLDQLLVRGTPYRQRIERRGLHVNTF